MLNVTWYCICCLVFFFQEVAGCDSEALAEPSISGGGGGLVNDAEVTKGVMTMVGFICPCDSRSPEQNLCDAVELLKGKNMKLLFLWLKLKRKITVDNNRSFFPGTISLLCLNRTMSF